MCCTSSVRHCRAILIFGSVAHPVEHHGQHSPFPLLYVQRRVQHEPIVFVPRSPLVCSKRPAFDPYPSVDGLRPIGGDDFHCRCGGWSQKSPRVWLVNTLKQSSPERDSNESRRPINTRKPPLNTVV